VKCRARREGAETQTEMGDCGDVRKMRKTWGLLLGCWGGSEDEDEEKTRTSGRSGGYGLSRTDAERGSSGAVGDSQCGTPDDPNPPPPSSLFSFFLQGGDWGPQSLLFGGGGRGVLDPRPLPRPDGTYYLNG